MLSILEKNPEAIVTQYREKLEGVGKAMILTDVHTNQSYEGILRGVDLTGALQMEIGSTIHSFHAGDVKLQIEGL